MPPSTSSNDAEHNIDLYAPYALADSHAHSYDYDRLQYRKRATRLVITPGGVLQHHLASYPPPPFSALLAAGARENADVSPAAGPPHTSASFRSAPQELLSSPPAANDLHTPAIAQGENDASPPLRFETPEPFLGDHDDPTHPLRPAAPPPVHNHQEHDNDSDNDAASPPDVKVILSSEAPAPSPFVQGTQRRATSSPACTSTPPASAYTIHPTTLISTSTSTASSSSSSAALPTNEASSTPLQSSIALLPTAVVANTSTSSTGVPLGIGASGTGTAAPASFSALHTVPFYVSVVFGSIAAAALLAALVAWAFRFRSAARVRREERIFGCRGTGNAGGGGGGDDEGGDGGGWAAWWSRPFMNRVGSGRESLATIETSEVADSYVSSRPPPNGGIGGVAGAGAGAVGVGVGSGNVGVGVGVGSGNVGVGGAGAGGAVPEGVWREWEHATGMSFGREMGVGSGTDMAMQRTVSSKRRHQARAAAGDGDGGEFRDEEFGGVVKGDEGRGSYYVHPPPQTYDAPTQPLENPFAPAHPYPSTASTSDSALAPPPALARSGTRSGSSTRERGAGRGRVALPRMDSLGSGVGLGLGLEFSGSSDLFLSADDGMGDMEGMGGGMGMGGIGDMGGMGGMGSMLRVTNRAEGDGMSVSSASRAGTALGMHEDGDRDRFSMSHSPTTPSPSTPIPASASTSTSTSTARPSDSGLGEAPSTRPLPLSSFPSLPSMFNAIKTTFGAAFSPSVNQGRGEEDRFTRAPARCGVKKTRKWAQMGGDVDIEEEDNEKGKGERERKEGEGEEEEGTKPLSVSKKHSRRYSNGNINNAKRLSLMRGVSARRVRDSFPVGLSKRGRGGMRRLGSSASRMSRAGGSSMGARSSTRGSGERGHGGWEDLDARSDYGFDDNDSTQDNDYGGNGDDEAEEDDGGRPRFLSRPSAASFLSSVSGVSVFSVDSVNSSREALVRERA
ncbi:hypothetical protein CCMSSC00406_0009539 [Pleurotus cornucopiae]|uniref:Uncharacterized protein n=1 Tax=Pleurotus cornucopiae TaxID=5321 RepID=A0ACB7IRH5_PLECO|nr:hypothetical protein CCMSSC00406_0009539 [Pleurotus cornucopiae]